MLNGVSSLLIAFVRDLAIGAGKQGTRISPKHNARQICQTRVVQKGVHSMYQEPQVGTSASNLAFQAWI